jgi:ABC-type sugar transport system ATPase subunit
MENGQYLEMKNISKGSPASSSVERFFQCEKGEIHALVGEMVQANPH